MFFGWGLGGNKNCLLCIYYYYYYYYYYHYYYIGQNR
jgi:hypothetical protein